MTSVPLRYLLPDDVAFWSDRLAASTAAWATTIGRSVAGRPLTVLRLGAGPRHLAVVGNAHADEPSGTATCLRLAAWLGSPAADLTLLDRFTFHLLPTLNPDGLAANAGWLVDDPPDLLTWARCVHRDPPTHDREFGYGQDPASAAWPEPAAWHAYLAQLPRLDGYLSLHSMSFAGGAWVLALLDDPTAHQPLLDRLAANARDRGLPLHDEDRGGRKGFTRIGPGACTAPTREQMAAYFARSGDPAAMNWLRLNSMQVARALHQTPVAIVSELPQWYDPVLSDMTPADRPRSEVDRRLGDGLMVWSDELDQIIEKLGNGPDDQLAGHARAVSEHRRRSAEALRTLAGDWGDRRAAKRDLASATQQEKLAAVQNSALAWRLAHAARLTTASSWAHELAERVARLERGCRWRALPLAEQVGLQTKMILALAEHVETRGAVR